MRERYSPVSRGLAVLTVVAALGLEAVHQINQVNQTVTCGRAGGGDPDQPMPVGYACHFGKKHQVWAAAMRNPDGTWDFSKIQIGGR